MNDNTIDVTWLDQIVTARTRLSKVYGTLHQITKLIGRGDIDSREGEYDERIEAVLTRDGTGHRKHAMATRLATIERELNIAIAEGRSVNGVLMGLSELESAATDTLMNTEVLVSDATEDSSDDPFFDRLEEHPAYERA